MKKCENKKAAKLLSKFLKFVNKSSESSSSEHQLATEEGVLKKCVSGEAHEDEAIPASHMRMVQILWKKLFQLNHHHLLKKMNEVGVAAH